MYNLNNHTLNIQNNNAWNNFIKPYYMKTNYKQFKNYVKNNENTSVNNN